MKIGLVLEGGGMRGLYTAGVLDEMMKKGFKTDVISGASAGVTFGINFPSHQIGRVLRYNLKYAPGSRMFGWLSFLTTGNIINKRFSYELLPNILDPFDYEAYKASGIDFFASVTNFNTGESEYIRITDCKEQMDVIRASASLPFLSRKVYIDGTPYLDGGIADSIPLNVCFDEDCDKVVVILTRHDGYTKKSDWLSKISRFRYPLSRGIHNAFVRRNLAYNRRLEEIKCLEEEGRIFVIRPAEEVKISRLEKDTKKLQALYDAGVSELNECWDALIQYISGQ